jgi:hypothetical protein
MSSVKKMRRQAVEEALRELEGRGDVALVNLVRAFIQGLEGRVAALELEHDTDCYTDARMDEESD